MTNYYNGAALSGGWNVAPVTTSSIMDEGKAPTSVDLAKIGVQIVLNSGVQKQWAQFIVENLGYDWNDPKNLETAYLCAGLVYLLDSMKLLVGGKRTTGMPRGGANVLVWRYNWLKRAYADVMKTTLFKKIRAFFHPRQPDGTSVGAEMTRKWLGSQENYAPFPRAAYLRQIPSKIKVNGQIVDLLKTAGWNDPAPGALVRRKRGDMLFRDWMLRPPSAGKVMSPAKKAHLKQISENKRRARITAAVNNDAALIAAIRSNLDAQAQAFNDQYAAEVAARAAAAVPSSGVPSAAAPAPPPPPPVAPPPVAAPSFDVPMSEGGAGYLGGYALAY